MFKSLKAKVITLASAMALSLTAITASASEGGSTLLPAEVTTMITGFAGDIVPTVLTLVGIVVPVGLSVWAISFAVKKGISFLQKRASKAL